MPDETARMRAARAAAEQGLVRVVHHYGSRPEFVLLGGLIPELLCSASRYQHAGTTDIDVQVDLEMPSGQSGTGGTGATQARGSCRAGAPLHHEEPGLKGE